MNLTKPQWFTLAAIAAYLICEVPFVSRWEASLPASDPVIRGDLLFIYPILLVLIILAIVQFLRNKSSNSTLCFIESCP